MKGPSGRYPHTVPQRMHQIFYPTSISHPKSSASGHMTLKSRAKFNNMSVFLNSPCDPCSPVPSIRHPLNQKPLPMLKPSIQRSSMIQKLRTKPNFSLSRRAARNLPRLGATPPRLGNPRPVSDLVRQPLERRRPLVNPPRPLHSDSPQEHPLLVNLLPLQRSDSSLLRAPLCRHLAHRPLLLGGHPPSVSQLLPNLHLEHLRSGNRHSVSPASVSPPHRLQLRVRAVVDSQLSHPSQQPLVSPPLVSQASVIAPLHQCSVSPGLGARQRAAELRRERVEVDSAPSHRLRLPTLHKQPPTHSRQVAPLGRVRVPLLNLGTTHLEHPLNPPPTLLDSLSSRQAVPSGLTLLHLVHQSRSLGLHRRLGVVRLHSEPLRRERTPSHLLHQRQTPSRHRLRPQQPRPINRTRTRQHRDR